MFEKVLVPTDFSAYAHEVLACVGNIPGVKEVVLLNVVSRPTLTRFWDPTTEVKNAEKKTGGGEEIHQGSWNRCED
jgi:hypothetical protein